MSRRGGKTADSTDVGSLDPSDFEDGPEVKPAKAGQDSDQSMSVSDISSEGGNKGGGNKKGGQAFKLANRSNKSHNVKHGSTSKSMKSKDPGSPAPPGWKGRAPKAEEDQGFSAGKDAGQAKPAFIGATTGTGRSGGTSKTSKSGTKHKQSKKSRSSPNSPAPIEESSLETDADDEDNEVTAQKGHKPSMFAKSGGTSKGSPTSHKNKGMGAVGFGSGFDTTPSVAEAGFPFIAKQLLIGGMTGISCGHFFMMRKPVTAQVLLYSLVGSQLLDFVGLRAFFWNTPMSWTIAMRRRSKVKTLAPTTEVRDFGRMNIILASAFALGMAAGNRM